MGCTQTVLFVKKLLGYLKYRYFFQVISLELATGIPMLYIVKEEKYIRRGSPAAPSEAGVYAYTKVKYIIQTQPLFYR